MECIMDVDCESCQARQVLHLVVHVLVLDVDHVLSYQSCFIVSDKENSLEMQSNLVEFREFNSSLPHPPIFPFPQFF